MMMIDEKSKLYQFLVEMCNLKNNNWLDLYFRKDDCLVGTSRGLTLIIGTDSLIESDYWPTFRISDGNATLGSSEVQWPDGTYDMVAKVVENFYKAFQAEEIKAIEEKISDDIKTLEAVLQQ